MELEVVVVVLMIALFWIIWTFYSTSSFLVRRLSWSKQMKVISYPSSYPTVQAIIDEVQALFDGVIEPEVQIQIYQFFGKIFEVLVLSLYLLGWVGLTISTSSNHLNHSGKHVLGPSKTNLTKATTQQLELTANNVEQVFRNNTRFFETTHINFIYVYSCPLTAPFSSSTESFRSVIQRQYLPVDFHAFIVVYTTIPNPINGNYPTKVNDGKWWSIDKQREGIFLSWGLWGDDRDMVTHFFKGKPRAKPIQMLISDYTNSTLSDLVRRLRNILKSNEYDLIGKNCQHFSKEIFDKFSTDKKWEFTTPIDMTSPLSLTTDGFIIFIIPLFILYELILLFMKSRENESSYYQYIVYVVTIVSFILLFFNDKLWYMRVDNFTLKKDYFCPFLQFPLEAVFYAPLYTIRKRGAQYSKMYRSGNIFYKCWLSLCFGVLYTLASNLILVYPQLYAVTFGTIQNQPDFKLYLSFPLYYMTSLDYAIPALHFISSCLFNILCNHHLNILIISSVVLTGFYLNLQDLTDDTRKIFVSNIRPSTSLTRRASW